MVGDKTYHVQTEDWGIENPFIVTRVFVQGAVVKTVKTPYHEILPNAHYDARLLENALKLQHYRILDQISHQQLGFKRQIR
ncbi:MAG: hypothetical protein NZ480_03340 [Bdellovibrionaceae bacterium]|nr:hypothetical protein [Pseudobdellovibrionaceae bacterium]MDW8189770.1 hypothetical protein [Pseudobdellovibrionaceae bacterium]